MARAVTLTQSENNLLSEFKNTLRDRFPQEILGIWLFGSRARGQSTPESDFDVLITTRSGDYHLADEIIKIATNLMLKYNLYISPKVISQDHYEELERAGSDFLYFFKMDRVPL
jgi:predicted nucleotidyltransferase